MLKHQIGITGPFRGMPLSISVRKARNRLLSQQTSCGMLEDGVDWTVPKRLVHKHKSRSDRLTGMRAVWQGAVLRGTRSGTTVCPLCQKEASTKHVLRECLFWKDRQPEIPRHWAKWEAEFPLLVCGIEVSFRHGLLL